MKHNVKRIWNALNRRILNVADYLNDRRICGQSLVKYVPSVFRDDPNGVGMTGSQSTHYIILNRIFSHIHLDESDCFLDVGCGKGRVLAFLLKQHCPCELYGIEINEISGSVAQEWTQRYSQVHVSIGDVFQLDYNQYTVLFLGRPFLPKTFLSFIERLESTLTHPLTVIYWVDQQSGHLLKNRAGWKIQMREKLEKIHGIKIANTPQSYSIWVYNPPNPKTDNADE